MISGKRLFKGILSSTMFIFPPDLLIYFLAFPDLWVCFSENFPDL